MCNDRAAGGNVQQYGMVIGKTIIVKIKKINRIIVKAKPKTVNPCRGILCIIIQAPFSEVDTAECFKIYVKGFHVALS